MPRYPDIRQAVQYSPDGPSAALLYESPELRVVLVGLEPGQQLPVHPGPAASFHFLEGRGTMTLDDDSIPVAAGATVIAPTGARRGITADGRLAFVGSLGNPGADTENPPLRSATGG